MDKVGLTPTFLFDFCVNIFIVAKKSGQMAKYFYKSGHGKPLIYKGLRVSAHFAQFFFLVV